ncbi:MAG: metallophosphoesterase [Clostridiales bacterium]|nr:metallophosphoesterase [Clostridiales bacterium]
MKLYVISDTHGKIQKALNVYSRLHSIDLILHLGDIRGDAQKIAESTGKTVICVAGNNDEPRPKDDFHVLETEYGNILLVHGHKQNVKHSFVNLLYRTCELNCKAVLFGHTHIPVFTESNGIYLLNPGSLTFPFDGTLGSYAIVNTAKGEFSASIVYYQDVF